jgi:putative MATE family efflux protein
VTETPIKSTKGIEILMGNPKKALIKLAVPMILAMSVQSMYNLTDAFWVSGLGVDALSAVGLFYPFFFMAMAIATGLGVGGGSEISRRIGSKDKAGADEVAVHTIIIMVLIAIIFSISFFISAERMFDFMGSGSTFDMAISYSRIMFAFSIFIFFTYVSNSILRAEGDAKRAMYAMILGSIINILLDPIFIYVLNMGVAGAAWATVMSLCVSAVIIFYWLFLKKNTFVSFHFNGFKFKKDVIKDIFKVGFPASIQQLSMSMTMIIMNIIIVFVAGTDGVAVYTTGWRIVTIAILPLLGISTAIISISGTAFGARNLEKIKTTHDYAIKIGFTTEMIFAVLVFIFAPEIASVFTSSHNSMRIADALIIFLRITCIFYPTVSLGMFSSSVFQGIEKGLYSLIVTLLRTVVLSPIFALLLAFGLVMGIAGVWWGLVMANITGSIVAFFWMRTYLHKLMKNSSRSNDIDVL